jgi:hypothetical protein
LGWLVCPALRWQTSRPDVIMSGMTQEIEITAFMSYRKTAHSVYDLKYHLVWVTKYRKPVLKGEITARLRELIRQTCAQLEVYIISGHVALIICICWCQPLPINWSAT